MTAGMWKELTRETWRARLRGVQRNVEVWQALLSVRSLVLPPSEDVHTYLKFASLCRKSGRTRWGCPCTAILAHHHLLPTPLPSPSLQLHSLRYVS